MLDYLINSIVAVWFGFAAKARGRNWFGWALFGGFVYFVIDRILTAVGNAVFGPVSIPTGLYVFFVVSTALNIGVMAVIGRLLFRRWSPSPTAPEKGSVTKL
jgi:hypothetical protein